MTPQQIDAMKLALEALKTSMYPQQKQLQAITALEEALAEHAMSEVQRLGQEIEQEPVCPDCKAKVLYECVACSSNNYPPQPEQEPVFTYEQVKAHIQVAMMSTTTPAQRTEQEPVAYYLPHKGFYWAKPTSISAPTIADVEPLPLYTTPPKETT